MAKARPRRTPCLIPMTAARIDEVWEQMPAGNWVDQLLMRLDSPLPPAEVRDLKRALIIGYVAGRCRRTCSSQAMVAMRFSALVAAERHPGGLADPFSDYGWRQLVSDPDWWTPFADSNQTTLLLRFFDRVLPRRERGRPPSPQVETAVHVWTVECLRELCGLALRDTLALAWRVGEADVTDDDLRKYRRRLEKVRRCLPGRESQPH